MTTKDKVEGGKAYGSENIKVLEGLEGVRQKFDVVEISKRIRRKGDRLLLSRELEIRPRILQSAKDEGRILSILPSIQKSKASILARLRTDREVRLFAKKYNLNDIPARKLIKLVREWSLSIQSNPRLLISDDEHDLIIGSLLGDASIRQREKNSCFRFSHSINYSAYANWKMNKMLNFSISEFREVKRRFKDRIIHALDFSTKTHPIFNYYRELFYGSGKKRVTKEILEQINPRSLAVWICDDGSYSNTQDYIILCTYSFSLEEHQLMKKFFEERFGLNPTIGFRDGKYYYLRFKRVDSRKLINIVRMFIPDCMKYKIGEIKND
mgnify:CR=1 FL=1